jgi:hypothetical protein
MELQLDRTHRVITSNGRPIQLTNTEFAAILQSEDNFKMIMDDRKAISEMVAFMCWLNDSHKTIHELLVVTTTNRPELKENNLIKNLEKIFSSQRTYIEINLKKILDQLQLRTQSIN